MGIKEDKILKELLVNRIRLTAFARSIVKDFHMAEDVFQIVSLKAIRSASQFNDMKHLTKWLWTLCRNEAIRKLKKESKVDLVLEHYVLDTMMADFKETSYANSEKISHILERCISKLSSYCKKLIMLRYNNNLTGHELAEALNKKVGTVYVALSRTHRELRECMQERITLDED